MHRLLNAAQMCLLVYSVASCLCINKLLRTDLSRVHLHIFLQIFSQAPQSQTVGGAGVSII